jgi:hypothetical protein
VRSQKPAKKTETGLKLKDVGNGVSIHQKSLRVFVNSNQIRKETDDKLRKAIERLKKMKLKDVAE